MISSVLRKSVRYREVSAIKHVRYREVPLYLEQLNQLRQDLAREEENLKKEAQIRKLEQQVREQQNRLELLRQNSSNQAMTSAQQNINPPSQHMHHLLSTPCNSRLTE